MSRFGSRSLSLEPSQSLPFPLEAAYKLPIFDRAIRASTRRLPPPVAGKGRVAKQFRLLAGPDWILEWVTPFPIDGSGLLGSQEDYRVDRSAANPRSSRKIERKVSSRQANVCILRTQRLRTWALTEQEREEIGLITSEARGGTRCRHC